ncbi:hypothetical protein ACFVRU_03715 [Streptomyces sp. NPDC057927]
MSDARLECAFEGGDYLSAAVDGDGDVTLRAYTAHAQRVTVMPTDAAVRTFARQLLALVGDESTGAPTAVKVGDRVEITKYRSDDRAHVGRFGTVTEIDTDDIPFLVHVDGYGGVWAMEVRKVTPTASTTRTNLIDEARRLAGSGATPADVLAYAKFLSE